VLNSKEGETFFSIVSSPGTIRSGYVSSWRVILYGRSPGDLVDSHVVELLNPPPPAGMDFSWVKPGVSLWDRRVGQITIDSFFYQHGTYSTWARMVDFAAKYDIPYLLIDSGWYGPQFSKESDPVNGGKAEEVRKLIAYARRKDVRVLLYINDIGAKDYPLEHTLQQYSQWGAAGIKVGFMRTGSPAQKNIRTCMLTAMCAKYHLLCNFHDGPIIPYGQLRSYPNAVTREYCHAQLDAHSSFYPKTFVTSVFVNMLAGPIDMNNGVFDLIRMRHTHAGAKEDMYHYAYKTTVPSTVTSEAARTLITFSGITCIPDIPEDYEKFPELLGFISSEKQPWKQSKTLLGAIGEYIVMARQAADSTWLVGAVTDESARKLDIPLSFLGGGRYEATILQDDHDAHYLTNRTAYKVKQKMVCSTDSVLLRLAPGGGACLIIKKKG
jgi:alpha-glucosidase